MILTLSIKNQCFRTTVETADKIERKQKLIDEDFIDLQTKFEQVNDVATEQKKKKKNRRLT